MTTNAAEAPVVMAPSRRFRSARQRPNVVAGIAGFAWLAVIIVPIYYVVVGSLRRQEGYYATNPLSPPTDPTLETYLLVLQSGFGQYFLNSVIVTLGSVVVTVTFSLLAAYAIVRSSGRLPRFAFATFLIGLAVPMHATIIPLYWMITRLRLYDSLLGLILPTIGFAIPLTVLILTNFVRDIPKELFESIRLDGAGDRRIIGNLVLPLAVPALVTVAIYNGMNTWNGFLFPLILTQSADKRVLPMALWAFQGEFTVNVPAVLAAVILSTLPILTAYVFGRRYLVRGLTAGFSK